MCRAQEEHVAAAYELQSRLRSTQAEVEALRKEQAGLEAQLAGKGHEADSLRAALAERGTMVTGLQASARTAGCPVGF